MCGLVILPLCLKKLHTAAFSEVKPVTPELISQKLLQKLIRSNSTDPAGILFCRKLLYMLESWGAQARITKEKKASKERNSSDQGYEKLGLYFA